MYQKDLNRIRNLAKEQAEIANSDAMQKLFKEWNAHGSFSGDRPMVTVELGTFWGDVVPPLLQCETEEGRKYEQMLLSNIVNHKFFHDDTVVRDFVPFAYGGYFKPFDMDIHITHTDGVGHQFGHDIKDLEEDFHKLKPSTFGINPKEDTHRQMEIWNEIAGDILPAKLVGSSLYAVPTQNIVHIMSMEDMYMAMYDAPELFLKMMDMLADDYLAYYDLMEKEGILLPTVGSEGVAQGSYCFNNILPRENVSKTTDVWGFLDSQETSSISPDMFKEFIFPAYEKLAKRYGMLSYGCCEPVDPIYDNCLSTLPNLHRVSISPWCNEEIMGERLQGKPIVYHRKPAPNFIGVGTTLDEDALRAHIRKTVDAAKGCTLEFTQRDVYTINKDLAKVKRYVEIIREESEHHIK